MSPPAPCLKCGRADFATQAAATTHQKWSPGGAKAIAKAEARAGKKAAKTASFESEARRRWREARLERLYDDADV